MELESYAIASKKARQVREVHLIKKDEGYIEHTPEEELVKQLERCVKALRRRGAGRGRRRATAWARKEQPDATQTRKEQPGATRKKGVCWGCGLPGHIRRNCTEENAAPAAPPPGNDDGDGTGHQGNGR